MQVSPYTWSLRERAVRNLCRAEEEGLLGGLTVILTGSAVSPYADSRSGVDLIFVHPPGWEGEGELRSFLEREGIHLQVVEVGRFALRLREGDDEALAAVLEGDFLREGAGGRGDLLALLPPPEELWGRKARGAWREMRRRRASLAWALRRGQLLYALENVVRFLEAASALTLYLSSRPLPHRKWLLQAALRTKEGQKIRPLVYRLLSSLGDLALLGGSYSLRRNRVYNLLGEIEALLRPSLKEGRGDKE